MPKLAQFRAKHDAPLAPAADSSAAILHIDMDAFFVSVELLARPELRGKAVIVGGQGDQRGVVTSASYEARKFGVHSAMALRTAAKLCPHGIFLDSHHELYGEWSDRIAKILEGIPRSLKWLRLTKPISTSSAPSVFSARPSLPRTNCCKKLLRRPRCRARADWAPHDWWRKLRASKPSPTV